MAPIDRFEVGDVAGTAVAVCARNFLLFGGLLLLAFAPTALWREIADGGDLGLWVNGERLLQLDFIGAVLTPLGMVWMQAGVMYGVIRDLRGGRAGFVELATQAFRATPHVAVVTVLAGLATAVGYLCLVVPGVVLFLFWVALPVAVVERRFGSALGRSYRLTNGCKWRILGLTLLYGSSACPRDCDCAVAAPRGLARRNERHHRHAVPELSCASVLGDVGGGGVPPPALS